VAARTNETMPRSSKTSPRKAKECTKRGERNERSKKGKLKSQKVTGSRGGLTSPKMSKKNAAIVEASQGTRYLAEGLPYK